MTVIRRDGTSTFYRRDDGSTVVVWFDRYVRLWTAYMVDGDDAEMGPAEHGIKSDIPTMIRDARTYDDAPWTRNDGTAR